MSQSDLSYKKKIKIVCCIVCIVLTLLASGGCRTSTEGQGKEGAVQSPSADTQKADRILYICSDTSINKISGMLEGIRRRCADYGMELTVMDYENKDSIFVSAIEELDATYVDAVMVTAANEKLGPIIDEKCREEGIPLISVESRLRNSEGQTLPYADISAYLCGAQAAENLADQAKQRGFLESGRKTHLVVLSMSNSTSVSQSTAGFIEKMQQELPTLPREGYIEIEVMGLSVEKQLLTINNRMGRPNKEDNYIMFAFNDEGGYALYEYARKHEMNGENLILSSVGGAQYAHIMFIADNGIKNSFSTIYNDFRKLGVYAVDALYQSMRQSDEPVFEEDSRGTVLTKDNYKSYLSNANQTQ